MASLLKAAIAAACRGSDFAAADAAVFANFASGDLDVDALVSSPSIRRGDTPGAQRAELGAANCKQQCNAYGQLLTLCLTRKGLLPLLLLLLWLIDKVGYVCVVTVTGVVSAVP